MHLVYCVKVLAKCFHSEVSIKNFSLLYTFNQSLKLIRKLSQETQTPLSRIPPLSNHVQYTEWDHTWPALKAKVQKPFLELDIFLHSSLKRIFLVETVENYKIGIYYILKGL